MGRQVQVRETVPDSFFKRADEVIDVDVSIDTLRTRMRQCKISKKVYTRRTVDLCDEGAWEDLAGWLLTHLEKFHRVFAPRVRDL